MKITTLVLSETKEYTDGQGQIQDVKELGEHINVFCTIQIAQGAEQLLTEHYFNAYRTLF